MSNILSRAALVASLVALATPAHAGNKAGNGGGALLKTDAAGRRTVELLDLWEAENEAGLAIPRGSAPVEEQRDAAILKLQSLNPGLAREVGRALPYVLSRRVPVPDGKTLVPPRDTGRRYIDQGYLLVGLMEYDDEEDRLTYDPSLERDLVSVTDRAAADVHEALYKVIRDADDSGDVPEDADSAAVRATVGYLFSNGSQPSDRVLSYARMRRYFDCASDSGKSKPFPEGIAVAVSRYGRIYLRPLGDGYAPAKLSGVHQCVERDPMMASPGYCRFVLGEGMNDPREFTGKRFYEARFSSEGGLSDWSLERAPKIKLTRYKLPSILWFGSSTAKFSCKP